jgi:hypothetical protein
MLKELYNDVGYILEPIIKADPDFSERKILSLIPKNQVQLILKIGLNLFCERKA